MPGVMLPIVRSKNRCQLLSRKTKKLKILKFSLTKDKNIKLELFASQKLIKKVHYIAYVT